MDSIDVEAAAELVKQAGALVVAAGAGMGVDSGLPEFRGDTGLWRAYPPLKDVGIRFEQIASPRTFDTDPRLAWGFYGHRLALYRQTEPHRGFEILRRWEQQRGLPTTVFTSNVDGQFQRAGFRGRRIHECHGSRAPRVRLGREVGPARACQRKADHGGGPVAFTLPDSNAPV